jgi:hypothetical protein
MQAIPYGSFDAPHRVKMGLTALAPGEAWLDADGDWLADLREKRRLLTAARAQVLAALPGSEPAQHEVLERVAEHLVERHPALAQRRGRRVELPALGESIGLDDESVLAIERAARLVQEDLCVMERRDAGWCLTAAAVCFPTRWDLPSKLGLPLAAIHDVVPGYPGRVAGAADGFFDALAPGFVFRRANWSLLDDPALFQPVALRGGAPRSAIGPHEAGDAVWLRIERQTLQRLAATGAILFTIRIHRAPLRVLARDPAAAAALAAAVRSMDAAMLHYKALSRVRDAALAYLDTVSPSGGASADSSRQSRRCGRADP